ncbi:MAG: ABC transporter ATP-binding protein [Nitrospinae bacterium]|nr:ABC transporter ATP-binding protein [Nitrospinota bacterium]
MPAFRSTLSEKIKLFSPHALAYRREIAIGVAALLLTDLAGLAIPWFFKLVVDLLPRKPAPGVLLQYCGLLLMAAAVQGVCRFGWRQYLFGPARKIEFDVLNRLMCHFLVLDKAYYQVQKVGDLMSRATNDLRAIRDFVGMGLLILVDSQVVILACLCLMIYINPRLTLYCMVPLPAISFLFYQLSGSVGRKQQIVQAHLSKITSMVQENLAGIRVLHAFVQEENEKRKFAELNREYIQKNLELARLYGVFTPSLIFAIGVAGLISLWIGGKAVIAGDMTLGSFVAFNGYLTMLSWPMMGIGYVFNLTQRGLSSMTRLEEILLARPSIESAPGGETPPPRIEGGIEFRGLNFRYPDARDYCLRAIDMEIKKGSSAAIIGMIGSGKSSLVQLLPRIFESERGTILIDGIPIQDIPLRELRRSIGYVDQEPFLFSASIRDNIVFGQPGAGEDEIRGVVGLAGLEPDLDRFPGGLDTMIGERGVSLSGGQKQRLALARALIKKPKILILDDAFSSLDAETEETVLKNIREYAVNTTTIFIAHRLSAVRGVDRIFVLEHGTVVEQGTHAELIRQDGYYRKIYKSQALARQMEIFMQ